MQIARVAVVTGLVVWAAVLATPKDRPPLALRGIMKLLGRADASAGGGAEPVGAGRRLAAFCLVVVAFAIALF